MSDFSEQQQLADTAEQPLLRERSHWRCVKCDHHEAEIGQARQSGSALASVFDVEGLKFTRVTCRRCGYTEFYRKPASVVAELLDLAIG